MTRHKSWNLDSKKVYLEAMNSYECYGTCSADLYLEAPTKPI